MDIPEWKGNLRRTWNWDLFLRGRQIKRELTAELGFFSLLVEGREEKERLFLNLVCLILLNAALWSYWLTFQACKARVLVIWNSYRIHILIKKKSRVSWCSLRGERMRVFCYLLCGVLEEACLFTASLTSSRFNQLSRFHSLSSVYVIWL